MVNNEWIADLQTSVFSRLKGIGMSKLKSSYPGIEFTTIPIDPTQAKFPTVYVHELQPTETHRDLEGKLINSIMYSIQIEVFANDVDKLDAKKISYVINDIMKSMMFEANGLPIPDYSTSYTRCISRYRRNISRNDIV